MLRKTRARKIAEELLEKCKINKAPVDPYKIIKQLPSMDIKEVKGLTINYTVQDFPKDLEDVSAILLKEKGQAVIAVNSEHSEVRKRFSISHELCHLILHSNNEHLAVEKQFFTRAEGVRNLDEIEANEFAAALLMPEDLIRKDFEKYAGKDEDFIVSKLSEKYKVSPLALTYRLRNLNLLY